MHYWPGKGIGVHNAAEVCYLQLPCYLWDSFVSVYCRARQRAEASYRNFCSNMFGLSGDHPKSAASASSMMLLFQLLLTLPLLMHIFQSSGPEYMHKSGKVGNLTEILGSIYKRL